MSIKTQVLKLRGVGVVLLVSSFSSENYPDKVETYVLTGRVRS